MPRDCVRRERARGGWEGRLGGGWLDPLPWSGGTRRGYLATSWAGVYMNKLSRYNGYYLPSKQRKRAADAARRLLAVDGCSTPREAGVRRHTLYVAESRSRIARAPLKQWPAAESLSAIKSVSTTLSVVIRVRGVWGGRGGRIRRPVQGGDKRRGRA